MGPVWVFSKCTSSSTGVQPCRILVEPKPKKYLSQVEPSLEYLHFSVFTSHLLRKILIFGEQQLNDKLVVRTQ